MHLETAETENNNKDFQLIKKYINKNSSIALDIGACIGNFTKFLAENCLHVYAFEPFCDNFKRLAKNCKKLDNVTLLEVAIGNKDSESKLYLCPNDIGMNRLYPSQWCKDGGQITVDTRKIDSLNLPNNKIDFVKIDVEGYEYYVLMGMQKLLERDHPTIFMEFHPPSIEESEADPKNIITLLVTELGYKQPIIVHDTRIKIKSYTELDNICRNKPAVNLLFIPR